VTRAEGEEEEEEEEEGEEEVEVGDAVTAWQSGWT
jgi:hypothetical protein